MKLQISAGAVESMIRLAIIARTVCGILVDMPELLNAGWLSILIGALLALPLMFAISRLRAVRQNQPVVLPQPLYAAFFVIAAWDAAAVASMIADSAGYLALNSTASIYLMIPQFILCLGCLLLNGDALGASAVIWNRFLPVLLLIVILLQADSLQPQWITPLLGAGIPSVLKGALRAAGWFSLPAALFLTSEPGIEGPSKPARPCETLAICALFSALISVFFSMTTPAIPDQALFSRTFRFDALLASGRSSRALQLPTIALWYPSLFYALLFDVFTGALMIQKLLPAWNRHACVWISLISTALFAASRLSHPESVVRASGWLFPVLGVSVVICILQTLFVKGANLHA